MLLRLLLAFTLIPFIELWILLAVGQRLGVWPTIALVIGTGFVGAFLAKSQGLFLLYRIQAQLAQGELPTSDLLHGLLVLVGGLLLLAPGLLTDITGFLFLFPLSRTWFKGWLERYLQKMLDQGAVSFMWRRF
ncbi:MAG: FxsA family protein [bacterium]|jgi:UPF0716 protein FxsA